MKGGKKTIRQNYLKAWRNSRGLTQEDLATRVATVKSEISRLEKGTRRLTMDWLDRLGRALRCDPADLLAPPEQSPRFTADVNQQLDKSSQLEGEAKIDEVESGMSTEEAELLRVVRLLKNPSRRRYILKEAKEQLGEETAEQATVPFANRTTA